MNREWQNMLAGELYDPADPLLVERRAQARALTFAFNSARRLSAPRKSGYSNLCSVAVVNRSISSLLFSAIMAAIFMWARISTPIITA